MFLLLFLIGFDLFHPSALYHECTERAASVILPQERFHLIGKGSQFFAFESEDGTLVLKLFKARHFLPKFSKRIQQFFSSSSPKRWEEKFAKTSDCYTLAFEELREETALVALHFGKSDPPYLITLVDGSKEYRVDISKLPFVVQKKATLLPAYLAQVADKQEALERVKALFAKRVEKKITDKRQSLRINYGFVDGHAVQIDPGKIYKDKSIDEAELNRLHQRVDRWARKHL
jgi:prepilin-type processing-associated H-X9-DG protein